MEIATLKQGFQHQPTTAVQMSVFRRIRLSKINTGVFLSNPMRLENTKFPRTTSILTPETLALDMISSYFLAMNLQTPDGI